MTEGRCEAAQVPIDPWATVPSGPYNSAIDRDLIRVYDSVARYSSDIAKELCLDEKYVELLQYVLCGADLCEYGTSPRGCWPVNKERDLPRLNAYFYETWEKVDD